MGADANERPQSNLIRYLPIQNADSVPIPPFALCAFTGISTDMANGIGFITVTRPTIDNQTDLFINGPGTVAPGAYGKAHQTFPAIVAYDDGSIGTTPAPLALTWGAAASSWLLTSGKTGFEIIGGAAGGLVNAINLGGGGGTVPDASYSVDGTVNLVNQALGKGLKLVDALILHQSGDLDPPTNSMLNGAVLANAGTQVGVFQTYARAQAFGTPDGSLWAKIIAVVDYFEAQGHVGGTGIGAAGDIFYGGIWVAPGGGSGTFGSSGGGGGGSIASVGVGSNYSTGTTLSILGVTVPANGTLVVNVGVVPITSVGYTLTFNGVPMNPTAAPTLTGTGNLQQWYLRIGGSPVTGDIVATNGAALNWLMNAVYATGVAVGNWSADANKTGALSAPDTGPATTAIASTYVQGAFLLNTAGGAFTWAGGFSSGSQDVSIVVSGVTYMLTEGFKILTTITTYDASLTGVSPVGWIGIAGWYF